MKKWLILLLVFTVCNGVTAQKPATVWAEAAQEYQRENYQAALDLFLSLQETKPSDELFYNMGNCYYKLDSIPAAILYYERALKLNPRFRSARENLALAKTRLDDPIVAIDTFFLLKWIKGVSSVMPPVLWGLLLVASIWVVAWLYVWNFRKRIDVKLRYKIISLVVVVVIAGLGYINYRELTRTDMVILRNDAVLYVAPDQASKVVRSLNGGEKLRIMDSLDGYYKVRLVNFEVGWLEQDLVDGI